MNQLEPIFDRDLLRRRRDRAAQHRDTYDFLAREVGLRLLDRLADTTRHFPLALDLACRGGLLRTLGAVGARIDTLIEADLSPAMARAAAHTHPGLALTADDEALPFAPGTVDLVLSNLSLHWANDLPGALIQIRRTLKPDGLFLGTLFGGETLGELRTALMEAELEIEGGVSPRISPFADLRDLGGLMQRAGFALPVVDCDTLRVTYGDALSLMRDLSRMGESNLLCKRRRGFTRRDTLARAAALYSARHAEADGRITATFQVHFLTGWAPDASQPQPLKPGSAQVSLSRFLGSED